MNASTVWWKQVTGPVRLIESMVEAVINHQSILLLLPNEAPWLDQFQYTVEERIHESIHKSYVLQPLLAVDTSDIDLDLINTFGSSESVKFRPHRVKSYDYLRENKILKNKIVWIRGISTNQISSYLSFLRNYKSVNEEQGLLIFETNSFKIKNQLPKHIKVINYFDYVTLEDTLLFASLYVSNSHCPAYLYAYVTDLLFSFFGYKVERIPDYIERGDFEKDSPIDIFKAVTQSGNSDYYMYMDEIELNHRLWQSQLRILFPILEQWRIDFIKKYYHVLESCLPIEQFKETIDDPIELEYGTIYYLFSKKQLKLSAHEYENLCFLRNVRNKLAHMQVCDIQEVNRILKENYDHQHNKLKTSDTFQFISYYNNKYVRLNHDPLMQWLTQSQRP